MQRIVIIGAGSAGIAVANTLTASLSTADNVEVVVLEKSAYFYHTYGTPRAYVDESYMPKLFVPYDNAIPKHARSFARIVRASATKVSVSPRQVSYHAISEDDREALDDTVLPFDYLVIATGSGYATPLKEALSVHSRADTETAVTQVRREVASASRILIVGGGPTGCEVAAEIAAQYPDKRVILIGAGRELPPRNNVCAKFRDLLRDRLATELNVDVILGERLITNLKANCFVKQTLTTDAGRAIEADIQLLCAGFHPAGELVRDLDASLVDELGFIRVNPQLQLAGKEEYASVFALGDATDNPSPKLGYVAAKQGQFVARELLAAVRKPTHTFTKPFANHDIEWMPIPFGPSGGISQLPFWGGIVVGDFFTRLTKSKDYFAGKVWYFLGATMPSE